MNNEVLEVQTKRKSKRHSNSSRTEITISQLNDDCLKCILSNLPFKDKLILQRVSKKWKALMPWSGQNLLRIECESFMFGQEGWLPYSLPIMKNVLSHCGNFITDIEIAELQKAKSTGKNLLKLLKESCPNLMSLELTEFQLTKPLIEFLTQNFVTLSSIGIGEIAVGCEKEIIGFFLRAKNLRTVKFLNSTVTGKCLKALPLIKIEEFEILGSEEILLEEMCKAFERMSSLRIFKVSGDHTMIIENIDKVLEKLPNISKLESLALHVIDFPLMPLDRERIVQMKNVCHLTNLQKLLLNGPQVVHDEALTIIGNTCTKLKDAVIIDSHKVTDVGWKNFAKLPNIEYLKIGQLESISEKCLDYLQVSSLKTLTCYKIRLTNKSFQGLLKSAKNLNCLDVALCPWVNRAILIKDASAQIESRPKSEILKLQIEMDNSIPRIKNISSRLVVRKTGCYLVELQRMQSQINPQQALFNLLNRYSNNNED